MASINEFLHLCVVPRFFPTQSLFFTSRLKLLSIFQLSSLEGWGRQAHGRFLQKGRVGAAPTQCCRPLWISPMSLIEPFQLSHSHSFCQCLASSQCSRAVNSATCIINCRFWFWRSQPIASRKRFLRHGQRNTLHFVLYTPTPQLCLDSLC